jgi:hypothetical protein
MVKDLNLFIIHIAIGLVAAIGGDGIVSASIIFALLYYFRGGNIDNKVFTLQVISYITSMEVLYRATGMTIFPYELSKYTQILLVFYSVLIAGTRFTNSTGIIIVLLTLPSLILFEYSLFKYLIFNSFGIVSLGILLGYCGNSKVKFEDFLKIGKFFLLPAISYLVFVTIKAPNIDEINFELGANFEASGGFGSNQVSTLFSAAAIFLIIFLMEKKQFVNRTIDLIIFLYSILRTFLTFSRGGMVSLVLSFILSYFLFKKISDRQIKYVIIGIGLFIGIAFYANRLTNGFLLLRYEGETAGTLSGNAEKDSKSISSGRTTYTETDIKTWKDNPILGVGPGWVQFVRFKYGVDDSSAPHTEATRLLAENGIFGLIINIILLVWPIYVVTNEKRKDIKFIKSVLFLFAYSTTFHSAMRTGISPLFYGLASLNIFKVEAV